MAKCASNSPAWAILGGTFDPVHIGHLRIALRLRDMGFERVLLIPNRIPPHRPQPVASGEQRLAMLSLACANLEGIVPCDIELQRDDYSYSAITSAQLKDQYPNVNFTWVMGQDAWQGFERWHEPLFMLEKVNLLIINRPGQDAPQSPWQHQQLAKRSTDAKALLHCNAGNIAQIHWPPLDISASDLRLTLKQGDNATFLTPDAVLEYIFKHQLYR